MSTADTRPTAIASARRLAVAAAVRKIRSAEILGMVPVGRSSRHWNMSLADGNALFAKVAGPDDGPYVRWALSRECAIHRRLQRWIHPLAPALVGVVVQGQWRTLFLEHVAVDSSRWTHQEGRRLISVLADFHDRSAEVRPRPRIDSLQWRGLGKSRLRTSDYGTERDWSTAFGPTGPGLRTWLRDSAMDLDRIASVLVRIRVPTTLIHGDLRLDNAAAYAGTIRFLDWAKASFAPAEFDLATLSCSLASRGILRPAEAVEIYSQRRTVNNDVLLGIVAGMICYYASVVWRPPESASPHVREIGRRQFEQAVSWIRSAGSPPT
jgi:hypothetical protein